MDPITEQLERGPDGLCIQVCILCIFHALTNKVANGEVGELLFRIDVDSPQGTGRTFQGYYGNESATKKKIARDVLTKGDCFFRTGDVVKCENDGLRRYTIFEDRIGDTFRWKGENVSTMVSFFLTLS
jgi:acyl-CoA synthetase (AMP-forming)/AMP-acid ligase II